MSQLSGHVGDKLRVTYTLRNTGRLIKPWLEIHNPTTLPGGLPGRALSLARPAGAVRGSCGRRSSRRGHFRIEPLQIRTGDPFGFFEASASVGQGITLVVYPRIDAAPDVAAAAGEHRGRATPSPSARSRRRRSRRPCGRMRPATR